MQERCFLAPPTSNEITVDFEAYPLGPCE